MLVPLPGPQAQSQEPGPRAQSQEPGLRAQSQEPGPLVQSQELLPVLLLVQPLQTHGLVPLAVVPLVVVLLLPVQLPTNSGLVLLVPLRVLQQQTNNGQLRAPGVQIGVPITGRAAPMIGVAIGAVVRTIGLEAARHLQLHNRGKAGVLLPLRLPHPLLDRRPTVARWAGAMAQPGVMVLHPGTVARAVAAGMVEKAGTPARGLLLPKVEALAQLLSAEHAALTVLGLIAALLVQTPGMLETIGGVTIGQQLEASERALRRTFERWAFSASEGLHAGISAPLADGENAAAKATDRKSVV